MVRLITTVFGIGLLRPAPGTWGSLAALPLFWGIAWASGPWGALLAIVLLFALGTWATAEATRGQTEKDPSEIVVDEVVGQWIALLPVAFGAAQVNAALSALWPGWIAAFVLFRLFDIWKPGPVARADARGDALGVMLDDVIAGLLAGLGVVALAALAHGVLLL